VQFFAVSFERFTDFLAQALFSFESFGRYLAARIVAERRLSDYDQTESRGGQADGSEELCWF
jgi:hypothetical protein